MSDGMEITLKFIDKFSAPMTSAIRVMEKCQNQALQLEKQIQKTGSGLMKLGTNVTNGITAPMKNLGNVFERLSTTINASMSKIILLFDKSTRTLLEWKKYLFDSNNIVKLLAATSEQLLLPIQLKMQLNLSDLITKYKELYTEQEKSTSAGGDAKDVFGDVVNTVNSVGSFCGNVEKVGKAFEFVTGTTKMAKGGTEGLKAAQSGLNLAFKASAVGWFVLGFIALIAIVSLIIKNWDKIKKFFKGLGKSIGKVFKKVGIDTKKLGEAFNKIKNRIGTIIKQIGKIIRKIINFIKPVISFIINHFVKTFIKAFSSIAAFLSPCIKQISKIINGVIKVLEGIIKFVTDIFTGKWKNVWNAIRDIFGGVFDVIAEIVKKPINVVISIVNGVISGINAVGFKIPKWVPVIGGQKFGIDIKPIPLLAAGTDYWQGGLAITQEKGGEIMDLPRGTRVYPHDKSIQMARQEGARKASSNVTVNISKLADKVEVRNDRDIDLIADRFANKLAGIIGNTGKVEFA